MNRCRVKRRTMLTSCRSQCPQLLLPTLAMLPQWSRTKSSSSSSSRASGNWLPVRFILDIKFLPSHPRSTSLSPALSSTSSSFALPHQLQRQKLSQGSPLHRIDPGLNVTLSLLNIDSNLQPRCPPHHSGGLAPRSFSRPTPHPRRSQTSLRGVKVAHHGRGQSRTGQQRKRLRR